MLSRYSKKQLGQIFLKNRKILQRIADFIEVEEGKLLEIGGGRGELTEFLLKKGVEVYTVEVDKSLCKVLEEKFKSRHNLKIINMDILDYKPQENFVVAGNVPYHLSFKILEYLVSYRKFIKKAYLTFQKEFARKLTAPLRSKDYSYLTCFFKYYAETKLLFVIPRVYFRPLPKVDSAFIEIRFRAQPLYPMRNEDKAFLALRKIFQQRRKKISNILKEFFPQEDIPSLLKTSGIEPGFRPEQIPPSKLFSLVDKCGLR